MVERELDACEACRLLVAAVGRDWHRAAAERTAALAEGAMVGRYRIEGRLGAGAMGVVYRAYDPVVARTVALKLISLTADADADEVQREARAMGQVNHPAVVRIYDAGVTPDHVYVAMELIEGPTLAASLAGQPRPARALYRLFADIAAGLAAAHDAGVVHRDFKPDNVLVSADGTPRVTDFGLARVAERGARASAPQIAGTPAYMAPEQLTAGRADERSDQYSFAVTLYEALVGRRPLAATSVTELALAMQQPVIDWAGLPRPARTLLARALAADPAARFGSMHEVAAVLRRMASPPRWPWVMGGLAGVAGATAVLTLALRAGAPADPCADAGREVDAAWSPAQAAQLARAYAAVALPYSAQVGTTARMTLDAVAGRLRTGFTDACRATHVQHTQSAELLDRRTQCLSRGVVVLATTSTLLAAADATIVANTPAALAHLGDVDTCDDVAALSDEVSPPQAPATRARVREVRQALADAQAAMITTAYADGIARATAAITTAQQLDYRPVEAEAWFTLGLLQYASRATADARASFEKAALAAVAGRSRLVEAQVREQLAEVLGLTLQEPAAAEAQLDLGLALLENARPGIAVHAQLLHTRAALLAARGDHAEALALHRRALALLPDTAVAARAGALQLIGDALVALDRAAEARPLLEQSAALARAHLGDAHPTYAGCLESLADARRATDPDAALALLRQAHDIIARALPAGSSRIAIAKANLGGVLVERGRAAEAVPYLREAIAITARTLPPGHPAHAVSLATLGKALWAGGDQAEGLALTVQAAALLQGSLGPDHPYVAGALLQHGSMLSDLRRYAEARPLLEAALATHLAQQMAPEEVADAQFALAVALWGPGRPAAAGAARVDELTSSAERTLTGAGLADRAAAIVTWRAAHPLGR